ncbi:nicotinate phosphoribosyltransferase [Bacillaceae bacterium]
MKRNGARKRLQAVNLHEGVRCTAGNGTSEKTRNKGEGSTLNLTLLTDLYQINMMYAYWKAGKRNQQAVFDVFYRQNPCQNGYVIVAGLEQVIEYVENLRFTQDDLDYLASVHPYEPEFLEELRRFRFTGDIDAIPEGTIVFPQEPLLRVKAPIFEAQLIETAILNIVNHQSLIATKASRIVQAAGEDPVLEFGLRRAQAPDAGVYGARAAYIAGAAATSNVLAGKKFGIPVRGTHSHSFVQSFPSELEAFRAFARTFPDQALLLVDTYDTFGSGIPNAIRVARELEAEGHKLLGIRIDSGDLAWISKRAREMLDEAGLKDAIICASSDLDEELIVHLKMQGAKIDLWGVGTNLITAYDSPALGGVYKLAADEENGQMIPKIKISNNPEKITNPGLKKVVRFYSRTDGQALADVIMLEEEEIPKGDYEIFHPIHTFKRKTLRDYEAVPLLKPIYRQGKLVYTLPSLQEIRKHVRWGLSTFSLEIRRLVNPHEYHVDLSQRLWDLKQELLKKR